MLVLAVMTMAATLAPAAVVNSITDDFGGDLSQWSVYDFSGAVTGATLDFSATGGEMNAAAVTSNTGTYIHKALITNDSVDATVENGVVMSTIFRTSASNPAKSYPMVILSPTGTPTDDEHLQRNAFGFQTNDAYGDILLRAWRADKVVDAEVRLKFFDGSGLGWYMQHDSNYRMTFVLDQTANQLTFTLDSLDGVAIVDGQTTATAVLSYTSNIWNATEYYGAYKTISKAYSGTDDFTVYADDFSLAVPEPTTMSLLGVGVVALLRRRRR
jgi:hypothetical protein